MLLLWSKASSYTIRLSAIEFASNFFFHVVNSHLVLLRLTFTSILLSTTTAIWFLLEDRKDLKPLLLSTTTAIWFLLEDRKDLRPLLLYTTTAIWCLLKERTNLKRLMYSGLSAFKENSLMFLYPLQVF